ncbi:DUF58 domain-containing protein [Aliikangiella maris]|uniref:DUF58 domain-containing protein n=2 Tax=Aliikangiella maris TaxID=3162458 RepID=A0ABV3MKB3_9GAMM
MLSKPTTGLKWRFRRFFRNRMPVGERVELNQRSTYIWPTREGYLLIVIVLLMLIGATNYQNNLAFLLTFLLISIGLVSVILTYRNIQDIQFTVRVPDELFADSVNRVSVMCTDRAGRNHHTVGLGLSYEQLKFIDIPAEQTVSLDIYLDTLKRGRLIMPGIMVSSIYPFGWLRTWAYIQLQQDVLVYPKPVEPPEFSQLAGTQTDEEGQKAEGVDDLYGLKPYQAGEPLSRIDWKAFARERGLFIREFNGYQASRICFSWNDFPGVAPELRLSYLTFLVIEAAKAQLAFALELPDNSVAFDEGEVHRSHCLQLLACYQLDAHLTEKQFMTPVA